jgi:hypothetical protein
VKLKLQFNNPEKNPTLLSKKIIKSNNTMDTTTKPSPKLKNTKLLQLIKLLIPQPFNKMTMKKNLM